MNCPRCGARMMEDSDMCVRCGYKKDGTSGSRNNTYRVNGQVLDASRTILDKSEIGKRRRNFLGPLFMLALLGGVVYLVVTYFPIDDIVNFFKNMNDKTANTIARNTLNNAKDYYTSYLFSSGGQSAYGKEFDISVLDMKNGPDSGTFVIIDDTEYGVELRNVRINEYVCNGTSETLKCVNTEKNEENTN